MEKPIKFPISFDKCLRIIIGGRLKANRLRIFRAWWRSELLFYQYASGPVKPGVWDEKRKSWYFEPLQKELIHENTPESIQHFRQVGIDADWFNRISVGIPAWRKAQQIKQRSEAAKTRWKKSKNKKS